MVRKVELAGTPVGGKLTVICPAPPPRYHKLTLTLTLTLPPPSYHKLTPTLTLPRPPGTTS